jgi:cytoskeletal protein CcmA (bactofilin family)
MLGSKQAGPSGPGTIVGANVKLIGTIQDASDITIHGRIEGEIVSSQAITITETAYIKGPVSGEIVTVAGKIRGSITATGKLEIMPTGKVFGSITCKDLSIRSGAIFIGKCTMPGGEKEEGEEKEDIEKVEEKKEEKSPAPESEKKETTYEIE